ncbi:cadherin-related family member 5 [Lacerta agilis]|uniref:cadherin-related family member 5 n=1 Tax=Lacerta agilis TaxID=80427 RepID=UPI00141A16CC|nr:cadherin-related family member 5 [Lacerta agilis]
MALFRQSCTWVLFLLLSAIHVQAQNSDCGVQDNIVNVQENNPPMALITNITAADGVTVKINPSVMNGDQFEIQNSQLLLKNSVDYEVSTALVVELQCFTADVVVNSIMVVVNIINVNDNPPVFPETNITVNVREDLTVNTTVVPQANVTAKDADKDTIYYSLTADPPVGLEYFNIEGVNNPEIYLLRTLDYEKINYMQFVLYAMDGKASEAPHTATATITIHILQADRRPPWFQPCTSFGGNIMCINHGYTGKVNISENMNESLVLEPGPLYAIDGDRDLNEKVEYAIADGNDDTFSINKDSGEITMNKTVNTLKTFMLYVVAFQTNNPYRYSQTTVEIKVVRRNDHKPHFEKTLYAGTVSVGLPVPSLVMEAGKPSVPLRIVAVDDDFTDKFNPDIKYQIQNSTNFTVTVDGFLLTAVVLDAASTVTLSAIANDTATLQEDSTLITVDVKPLETTTILPTTITTTGAGTTISDISDLPPGTITTLPVTPSASTTRNTAITEKPATGPTSDSIIPPFVTTTKSPIITGSTLEPQTASSPITGISQATDRTDESTAETTFQSGVTEPSISTATGGTVRTVTSASSQTGTTTTPHPITDISPGTDKLSTANTPSQAGTTTKHPITGETPATDDIGQSTTKAPQTQTTKVTDTTVSSTVPTPLYNGTINYATGDATGIATLSITTSSSGNQQGNSSHRLSEPVSPQTPTTTSCPRHRVNMLFRGRLYMTFVMWFGPAYVVFFHKYCYYPCFQWYNANGFICEGPKWVSHFDSHQNARLFPISGYCFMFLFSEQSCPYRTEDMVALGTTLGCLLLVTLVLLGLVSYKYYKLRPGEDSESVKGLINSNFEGDKNSNSGGKDDKLPPSVKSEDNKPVAEKWSGTLPPLEETAGSSQEAAASETNKEGEEGNGDTDSDKEVRSILTKDRRMSDDGYKAVWFKEDIDPEAKDDVLMIENDSDTERKGNESDSDNADDQAGDNEVGDGARGDSDRSFTLGRPQLPEIDSTDDLQDIEVNGAYL